MIEKITIQNYILLKDIDISFDEGLNIITGETGTGKSILINAIGLLIGERADFSIIKKNDKKLVVESIIKINKTNEYTIKKILNQNEIEINENNILILRREIKNNISRIFINDTPSNASLLKEVGNILVDIHSQNEHQSLIKKENHVDIIDSYIKNKKKEIALLDEYKKQYDILSDLIIKIEDIKSKKNSLEEKKEFLIFQLKEINDINPQPNEDEKLEKEIDIFENIENIQNILNSTYQKLYDEKDSVLEKTSFCIKELSKIEKFDVSINDIIRELETHKNIVDESAKKMNHIINSIETEAQDIEPKRERLYKLQFLKKKYGANLNCIIEKQKELNEEIDMLESLDDKILQIEKELNKQKKKLYDIALEMSKERKKKSLTITEEVEKVFKEIGLENASFKINQDMVDNQNQNENYQLLRDGKKIFLTEKGIDNIEFFVRTNKGEEFSPLRKTASGGEISRIMLALKTVLAEADKTEVLIFDETDTGISGSIAQKVGKLLKKLSKYHQIISVTHLPQIASFADEHFVVCKNTLENETNTEIIKLKEKEKEYEIAKLLSGEKITDTTIASAKELIKSSIG